MSEASAYDGDPLTLEEQRFARCSRDACVADIVEGRRAWRLLAIRSRNRIDWTELTRACADADIVVADRWLPKGCAPRWLKLDRKALEQTGGVAIYLGRRAARRKRRRPARRHPWASDRRRIQAACHTASSLPDGSMKWKRRPPGKEKIGLAMIAAGLHHRVERRFEVIDPDHRQRRGQRLAGLAVEAKVDIAAGRRGIIGAEIGEVSSRTPWHRSRASAHAR